MIRSFDMEARYLCSDTWAALLCAGGAGFSAGLNPPEKACFPCDLGMCTQTHTSRNGPSGLNAAMASISQTDPCSAIISWIAAYGSSIIPVPALSRLLGVKSTTLNARFRRKQILLRTIGRTNYLPYDQALQLVELHRYALIGWPTLQAASKITDVKPATLKARCEKGRLEGHIDLTKRLRLNPAELEGLCSAASRAEVKVKAPRFAAWAKSPARKNKAKAFAPAEMKEEARFSEAKGAIDTLGLGPVERPPFAHGNFALPTAPKPKIEIIGLEDYGLPEVESPSQTTCPRPQRSEDMQKQPPCLVYDPLRPFSLSVCSPGKAVRYGQYVGTVLGLIDDPYNPKIKVAFPEHDDPVMREVLLVVDKKKRSGVLS